MLEFTVLHCRWWLPDLGKIGSQFGFRHIGTIADESKPDEMRKRSHQLKLADRVVGNLSEIPRLSKGNSQLTHLSIHYKGRLLH